VLAGYINNEIWSVNLPVFLRQTSSSTMMISKDFTLAVFGPERPRW